ncbi:MAG: NAD(P)-dependent oxidoreductase [Planctomycetota bacterium]
MSALRIGWIGTGVMGEPMAGHLMDAGHSVTVHTRTRKKAEGLIARGAAWAENAAAAADSADVVFSMVGFPTDVEATHLGPKGTLAAENPAPLLVDMTTTRPALARRIHEAGAERGVGCVDAPVSGGDVGARKATLSIMVGGDAAHVREVQPLLELLGGQIVHQGGPGAGQHTKMVNQILIATNMIGVCEGLLYATAAGLDPTTVLESVGSGAAGSWSVANLAPRMIRRDFEPGFFIEHFLKDLGIALDEANRLGLALPGLAMAKKLYEDASRKGLGRKGTQALLLALEHAVKGQGEGRG